VQLDPMKPKSKLPGAKRLKLKCDIMLSTGAFKYNLRRHNEGAQHVVGPRDPAALAALLGAAGAEAVAALEAKVAVTPDNLWRRAPAPGGAGTSEAGAYTRSLFGST